MTLDTSIPGLGVVILIGIFLAGVAGIWLGLRLLLWTVFRVVRFFSKKSDSEAERVMAATINATCLGIPLIILLAYPYSPITLLLSWLFAWAGDNTAIYFVALCLLGIFGFASNAAILEWQFKRIGRELSIERAAASNIFAFVGMIPSIVIISAFQFGYDELVTIGGLIVSLILLASFAYSGSKSTKTK